MTKIEALELELAARKMVEGTGLDWWNVIRSPEVHVIYRNPPTLNMSVDSYELALGIIKGKPVWRRDIYYDGNSGYKTVADEIHSKEYWARCSWNPPAPKTVMVELPIDTAKESSRWYALGCHAAIGEACRKSLENLK